MRILFLTTEFPWPAHGGGRLRTLGQLRLLAGLAEVEQIVLLSVSEQPVSSERRQELQALVSKLTVEAPLRHPVHLWDSPRHLPRLLARRLAGIPYLAAKWETPALRARLQAHWASGRFDWLYVDHLGMAGYVDACPGARVVLDTHNVESDLFADYARRQRGPWRWLATVEAEACRRFERQAVARAARVIAISTADAERLRALTGATVHVVPVWLAAPRSPVRPRRGSPKVIYVGSLRWHPNVAGLDWFCAEVWPRIRAEAPAASLDIVGVDLRASERRRWRGSGIEVVGFVADLEPLLAEARVLVAPVHGGSGVRVKILDGFRTGIPVVTTPDGAAGLAVESERELLIADEAPAFARHVLRLLHEPALAALLVDHARAYLERHHGRAVVQAAMRVALGLA